MYGSIGANRSTLLIEGFIGIKKKQTCCNSRSARQLLNTLDCQSSVGGTDDDGVLSVEQNTESEDDDEVDGHKYVAKLFQS